MTSTQKETSRILWQTGYDVKYRIAVGGDFLPSLDLKNV